MQLQYSFQDTWLSSSKALTIDLPPSKASTSQTTHPWLPAEESNSAKSVRTRTGKKYKCILQDEIEYCIFLF